MKRLERRETKNEIVSDGEKIEIETFEQEAGHVIRENDALPHTENDGRASAWL
jgi:hypothetical protein